MRPLMVTACLLAGVGFVAPAHAQAQAEQPFAAGTPLEMSPNVKVYGSFRFAESCSFDEARNLIVVPSAGIGQNVIENDGYVSLINPDGTVHTPKWIGVNRNGLTLNHPLGSDIQTGMFYVADIDTVRWFDMATGAPAGSAVIEGAAVLNDIEVASDGTIYASQHGNADGTVPWRLYKVAADGTSSIMVEGGVLNRPNGVAFDPDGNIVVVQLGDDQVLTFSPEGELLGTETSLDPGNDGLVILADGTKYVSSVQRGRIARIPPDGAPEEIATGVPSPASMCYDPNQNQLILPMNNWNAIGLLTLD